MSVVTTTPDVITEGRVARSSTPWWKFPKRYRNPIGIVGAIIVLTTIFIAIFAPLIAPYDPSAQGSIRLLCAQPGASDGHRRARPRHLLAHRLWRARVAAGRHRLGDHRPGNWRLSRIALRLFRRPDRYLDDAAGRYHVRLSRNRAGDRDRRVAWAQPAQRDDRHRHHLCPGICARGARHGALSKERGVHRSRQGARLEQPAYGAPACGSQTSWPR